MEQPPDHHQIDGQAGFDPVVVSQLPIFDFTARLERAMEDLDPPAFEVEPTVSCSELTLKTNIISNY
jgi:hypothetical protein